MKDKLQYYHYENKARKENEKKRMMDGELKIVNGISDGECSIMFVHEYLLSSIFICSLVKVEKQCEGRKKKSDGL